MYNRHIGISWKTQKEKKPLHYIKDHAEASEATEHVLEERASIFLHVKMLA